MSAPRMLDIEATLADSLLWGGPVPEVGSVLALDPADPLEVVARAFYDRGRKFQATERDDERRAALVGLSLELGIDRLRWVSQPDEGPFDLVVADRSWWTARGHEYDMWARSVATRLPNDGLLLLRHPVLPGAILGSLGSRIARAAALTTPGHEQAATSARGLVASVGRALDGLEHPYASILRGQLGELSQLDERSLVEAIGEGDAGSGMWHPEVAARLAAAGLRFVGESTADDRRARLSGPLAAALEESGLYGAMLEEARDIVTGRRERCDLYALVESEARAPRDLSSIADQLEVASILEEVSPKVVGAKDVEFATADGRRVATSEPMLVATLRASSSKWPRPIASGELLANASKSLGRAASTDEIEGLWRDLLALRSEGLVVFRTKHASPPPGIAPAGSLFALTTMEARLGRSLTTPFGTRMALTAVERAIVLALSESKEMPVEALLALVRTGQLPFELGGARIDDPDLARPLLAALVERSTQKLRRAGLLA